MTESRQAVFTVRSDKEWEAINSPVRLEMIVFLNVAGTCAIRELATLMNRPADGLYHHLRKLLRVGLVTEVGTRRVGKQTETLYRTIAADITIDRNVRNQRTRERTIRLFRTILQHAQRTVEAALNSDEAVLEGPRQNLKFNWLTTWLSEEQLSEVRAHQAAIAGILQEGLQRRQGQLIAVLTYMAPVQRPRGSERSSE